MGGSGSDQRGRSREDLRNPEFAKGFLLASIDKGISLQHALGKLIRATGVKEFAANVGMASPNLLGAINPRDLAAAAWDCPIY
jgi:DNA-binding phage protein